MEIMAHVGGTPGLDCGGFCEFCFFKTVEFKNLNQISLGCRYCPPHQIGCNHCRKIISDAEKGFKPLYQVLDELRNEIIRQGLLGRLSYQNLKINLGSWADIISYPQLNSLIKELKEQELYVHLGYTSGKAIKDVSFADDLISLGVDEVSFSVFSLDPDLRRRWMRDTTPEVSLQTLKILAENIMVHGSTVVVPGVIDKDEIYRTCSILEEWGLKSFTLSRFANYKNQGLILNKRPIIDGINPQPIEEFRELVRSADDEFSFKVVGFPAYDPENDVPFGLSKKRNMSYLEKVPSVTSECTVLTSTLSAPYLEKIFGIIDESNLVNIVPVDKEICDLITQEDLESVDLSALKYNVIMPGGALVHDLVAKKILSKDGREKRITRGPQVLCLPALNEQNIPKEEFLKYELKSFQKLVDVINSLPPT